MRLYSTNNRNHFVSLKEAVFKGLPKDKGLYMPETIPTLSKDFIQNLRQYSFQEIGFEISKSLFEGAIPLPDLRKIIENAITFPAPLVALDEQKFMLELFHGPSLAFKDFGARFMAQLMGYLNRGEDKELVILVATSGDTGGAVAAGFYQTPGIRVVILYPSKKVSPLQEKQLTTLGDNITAIEIAGTFDDCQDLVKKAFLDETINTRFRLGSANSINIARLIPQSFYYFEAYRQVQALKNEANPKVIFSVPSGNFGNLTAGILAHKMGLPVEHFVAATNANDIVPKYIETGDYSPRPSVRTLSNAMDVGNPSNFSRLLDIFAESALSNEERSTWNNMRGKISGFAFNDKKTKQAIIEIFRKYNYIADPHAAVGYLALLEYFEKHGDENTTGIIHETAHPSKFKEDMDEILGQEVPVPERLAVLAHRKKEATLLNSTYPAFKSWLIETL
ncbi:MAG: threonine synthase [Saprospiraceae bacterium]